MALLSSATTTSALSTYKLHTNNDTITQAVKHSKKRRKKRKHESDDEVDIDYGADADFDSTPNTQPDTQQQTSSRSSTDSSQHQLSVQQQQQQMSKKKRKSKKKIYKHNQYRNNESAIQEQSTASASGSDCQKSKCVCAWQYLNLWHTDRLQWKFAKQRQIFILQHLYDKQSLPKAAFTLALAYMQELKGKARELTLEQAKQHIEQYEKDLAEGKIQIDTTAAQNETVEADTDVKHHSTAASTSASVADASKLRRRMYQRARKVVESLS